MAKVEATRSYGATVEMTGASFEEAVARGRRHAEEAGAVYVHAFEDADVVAGQGTVGLELAEQLEDVETVVVPVGGGGLVAGIALGVEAVRPEIRVVGVQTPPEGFAVADGIAVKQLGELPRAILDDRLDSMVEVSGAEIAQAIVLVLERTKLVVEGAGAAGVAALLAGRVDGAGPVAVVLSGGNVDATTLISVMPSRVDAFGSLPPRSYACQIGRELQKLLDLVATERINVLDVEHRREGAPIAVDETEIWLTLETRDEAHAASFLDRWRVGLQRGAHRLGAAAPEFHRLVAAAFPLVDATVEQGSRFDPAAASTAAIAAREPISQTVTSGRPPARSSAKSPMTRNGMLRLPGM